MAKQSLALRMKRMRILMDKADMLGAKLKPIDEEIRKIRDGILEEFSATELNGATASGLQVARTKTPVPRVKDQLKFFAFATKKPNWDLLQKSVATPAWRERMEANPRKSIPGVDTFNVISLQVRRIKKGK